ncbi:methylated-DNA--[protein]-cysteine S-methyltransferase [Mobilitalea sibirica]|uniref:Methylated-DNA--protein-cysteine methyltransferase n=1 Tax=Mobilitalea sibirica TaxID=1462919 RepID=A0A8J7HA20_9FIRM|nr:methylated-DNA--[protein]-cysteine S-methyltransferase [Mobilitalea sibirica]MBH1939521.1 methylated-DNA--[protein]-cysteine S-methyltransferase [Mobilitalea sibirica]
MNCTFYYNTKIGKIRITEDGAGITQVSLVGDTENVKDTLEYKLRETDNIKNAASQLMQYLEGTRKEFTIPLHPQGTIFQLKVWEALRSIPYGETRTYKQIAEMIGNPKASRAVGMANHNNPIMCMIPCHRVIGANGSLTGYAGGLDIKEKLLELEGSKERK